MKITRTSPLTGHANTLDLPLPNAAFAGGSKASLSGAAFPVLTLHSVNSSSPASCLANTKSFVV